MPKRIQRRKSVTPNPFLETECGVSGGEASEGDAYEEEPSADEQSDLSDVEAHEAGEKHCGMEDELIDLYQADQADPAEGDQPSGMEAELTEVYQPDEADPAQGDQFSGMETQFTAVFQANPVEDDPVAEDGNGVEESEAQALAKAQAESQVEDVTKDPLTNSSVQLHKKPKQPAK